MIEVEVENFQSIAKAAFKIDGFTALVGRSNIGKSALVRAFRNALTGAPGTDFVRHGASCERRLKDTKKCKCQTTVRIRTSSVELVWEKGDAVNRYTVTKAGEAPVLYDKVDRGTPDFLRPDFTPIKVGDEQELIQVSEQFNPIFLLGASGPAVADVLSDVARLDDINEAIRLVTKDRKEASATRTVRERDVATLALDLASYTSLDLAVADVQKVEAHYSALQIKQGRFDNAKRFLTELEGLAKSIRGLQAATKPDLPDENPVQATSSRLLELVRLDREWASRTEAVERLSGVEDVTLPVSTEVEVAQKRLTQVDGFWRKAQALKADFDRGKALAATSDPDHAALVALAERYRQAHGLFDRIQALGKAIAALQTQLEAAEEAEATALEELRALGLCPTCSQPVAAEHHLHLEAAS